MEIKVESSGNKMIWISSEARWIHGVIGSN